MAGTDVRPTRAAPLVRWREGTDEADLRLLPEETAVALVHDATTTAVLMASPADLEDLAVGFSLTEGLVARPQEISSLEVVASEGGIEVRMWLAAGRAADLAARRRTMAGPTGCGLCGIESLAEAMRPPRPAARGLHFAPIHIQAALAALEGSTPLGRATRAVHAAGWWTLDQGLVCVREDVGRHNALDKLAGALARAGRSPAEGMLVLTSRVSVDMVQKAAAFGAQVLVAVSAPTALALDVAREAGLTVAAVARADGFEVYCGAERIG